MRRLLLYSFCQPGCPSPGDAGNLEGQHSDVLPDRPFAWAAKRGAIRILSWWVCVLLSGLYLWPCYGWRGRPSLTELMITLALSHLLSIAAGVSLILTILGIARRQRLRYDTLMEHGDSPPSRALAD